jgi:hypothetical protein
VAVEMDLPDLPWWKAQSRASERLAASSRAEFPPYVSPSRLAGDGFMINGRLTMAI